MVASTRSSSNLTWIFLCVSMLCGASPIRLRIWNSIKSSRPTTRNGDRKSTRLNSSHLVISYAVFCLKKKKKHNNCRSTFHPTQQLQPILFPHNSHSILPITALYSSSIIYHVLSVSHRPYHSTRAHPV